MRVGILALLQESNTFIARPTTLSHFEQHLLAEGEAVRKHFAAAHHEVGGFFEGLAAAGIEAAPLFAARALPFGTVEREAIEALLARLMAALERAGPLDGLLVAPHGATVSEPFPDVDGRWLSEARRLAGDIPIIGTLDPHGNLSPAMVAACDALIAYRTNPHVDQRMRGVEAARLMTRAVAGEVRPTMAAAYPPMIIDIERQCTEEEPCRSLCEQLGELRRRRGVLSASLMLGFPYADVPEMGSAVIVVTDNDAPLAESLATEFAVEMWQRRHDLLGEHTSLDEALDRAAALRGPVCLLDMGDNVGGGAPGDGTLLAHAIHGRRMPRSFVCLCDPDAVLAAEQAGAGARIEMPVGGKTDNLHGRPLKARLEIVGFYDGKFEESQPRHGGMTRFDQGRTAIVRSQHGLTIMLTTRRMTPFSLAQLTSCGLEPAAFHLLVAKGVNAPLAAYAPVCEHVIRVDTPGVTTADVARLDFRRRRRPMFPFEPETKWLEKPNRPPPM